MFYNEWSIERVHSPQTLCLVSFRVPGTSERPVFPKTFPVASTSGEFSCPSRACCGSIGVFATLQSSIQNLVRISSMYSSWDSSTPLSVCRIRMFRKVVSFACINSKCLFKLSISLSISSGLDPITRQSSTYSPNIIVPRVPSRLYAHGTSSILLHPNDVNVPLIFLF